jgi:hypothetical protein
MGEVRSVGMLMMLRRARGVMTRWVLGRERQGRLGPHIKLIVYHMGEDTQYTMLGDVAGQ